MKITNVEISGIASSIVSAGYAMRVDLKNAGKEMEQLSEVILKGKKMTDVDKKHIDRLIRLGTQMSGSGHRSILKGITVSADFERTQCIDHQMQRYNFFQYITGQSTMHRLKDMKLRDMCHEKTSGAIITLSQRLLNLYNLYDELINCGDTDLIQMRCDEFMIPYPKSKAELFESVCYSLPAGLQLTVRATTNYECLLNMYFQRKNHKLGEWKVFCDWVYSLPFMSTIINIIGSKRIEGKWQTSQPEPIHDVRNVVIQLKDTHSYITDGIFGDSCEFINTDFKNVLRWRLI